MVAIPASGAGFERHFACAPVWSVRKIRARAHSQGEIRGGQRAGHGNGQQSIRAERDAQLAGEWFALDEEVQPRARR